MLNPQQPNWGYVTKMVTFAIVIGLMLAMCGLCATCSVGL